MLSTMINIALVGYGHWGPNYARLIAQDSRCELLACVDTDAVRCQKARADYPGIIVSDQLSQVLQHPLIDALIIATPAWTHYALVQQCLAAGKHVLCEKPLSLRAIECEGLHQQALSAQKILMVDHTFLFNPGILALKAQLPALGPLHYLTSTRTHLGPIRADVDVLGDLASHDIAIFNDLLGALPVKVSACGGGFLPHGKTDVAFVTLWYPHGVMAHLHTSWFHPVKVRQMVIVGAQKMMTFDDLNHREPLHIHDAHVKQEPYYADFQQFKLLPHQGPIDTPEVLSVEPLQKVLDAFLQSIASGQNAFSDGAFARNVARVLAAIDASIAHQGSPICL